MDNLYREEILDHYKYPRNKNTIADPDVEVKETNRSCGDQLHVQLKLDSHDKVEQTCFNCQGCAISTAVSSMLSELVQGKTVEELKRMTIDDVYSLLGGPVTLGRVKCVGLALKALQKAIEELEKKES